jgi:O-6-methylguanine DNA methyltransferase
MMPARGSRGCGIGGSASTRAPGSSAAFAARVLAVVRRIPPGRVATYGDVAAAAGSPRAHRAVGNVMRTTKAPGVPAHRVIAAGGRLGGYGGNLELKRALLRAEGLIVTRSSVKAFAERRWKIPGGERRTGRRADS